MSEFRPTIAHVLHRLDRAGAEVLAAGLARQLQDRYRFVFLCLDAGGPLGDELAAEGFEVVNLDRKPGLDFKLAGRLQHEAHRLDVNIIHAHQYTPFFYSALARLRAFGGGPRIVFTEHGRHYPDQRKLKRIIANRLLLQSNDRVTAVGQFIKQALVRNEGIPSRRIEVIHNGVPTDGLADRPVIRLADRLAARAKMNVDRDDRVVLQVARFHPVKDHETAVRAFELVTRNVNRARLVFVGDGPQRTTIAQLAKELGVDERITFTGVRSDVADLLAGADVFMLSSLSEGISVTLLEAMAAGLAICATDVGGNSEVVDHGRTGLLSPRRDPESLANHLTRLLKHPHERAAMGALGRERLIHHFSEARMHAGYAEVYDAMLAQGL